MLFEDRLTLDAPRRTQDGYLAVRAKAARVGHYEYTGRDVDPENKHGFRDQAIVKVAREADQVFDKASAHSFIGKPITNDHPSVPVTSANWKDHASGTIMGAKWEEGGYLSFDLMLTDAGAISAVEGGKRELSNGYSCDLVRGDFVSADGTACPFKQTNIRGNHVALVDRGRAGPECAIRDAAVCASAPPQIFDSLTTQEKPVKTMLIDGLTVDISNADTAQATIATILAARDAANTKAAGLETQVSTLTAEGATKDAKITTLEQQVADAKPTPQQLRDAGKALIIAVDKAKALGVTVSDEMDEAAIMKATVDKQMGDAAKDWTADQIAASFAVLTKDAKPAQQQVQPIGTPRTIGDAATAVSAARTAWLADKQGAYRATAN
ncbi:DUF2213 domain-containing protein [Sphingomonas xinjiangensis]|uniref:DUF2213 domain-containing protein n=1 Tax=Sphingomonas xinjiangensis TaxID=643568 RepID=A0A840YNX8_9SPHN|nr:DUF2213 domain-containing protein [Sphingomonas xinjiangensis]MBB5709332.1 hypothetical protein [Sphingomonas xinjiangensis]